MVEAIAAPNLRLERTGRARRSADRSTPDSAMEGSRTAVRNRDGEGARLILAGRACRLVLGIAVAIAAATACTTTEVGTLLTPPPPVDQPSLSVGDRWVFTGPSGARSEIVYQGRRNDALVFRVTGVPPVGSRRPTTLEEVRSGDLAKITGTAQFTGAAIEYRPDDGALRFPLAVGKSWRHSYVRVIRHPAPPSRPEEQMIVEATVKSYERIRVPAGSLAAFRIESTIRSAEDTAPPVYATYWYAPAVKTVIKYQAEAFAGRVGLKIEGDALAEYEFKR